MFFVAYDKGKQKVLPDPTWEGWKIFFKFFSG